METKQANVDIKSKLAEAQLSKEEKEAQERCLTISKNVRYILGDEIFKEQYSNKNRVNFYEVNPRKTPELRTRVVYETRTAEEIYKQNANDTRTETEKAYNGTYDTKAGRAYETREIRANTYRTEKEMKASNWYKYSNGAFDILAVNNNLRRTAIKNKYVKHIDDLHLRNLHLNYYMAQAYVGLDRELIQYNYKTNSRIILMLRIVLGANAYIEQNITQAIGTQITRLNEVITTPENFMKYHAKMLELFTTLRDESNKYLQELDLPALLKMSHENSFKKASVKALRELTYKALYIMRLSNVSKFAYIYGGIGKQYKATGFNDFRANNIRLPNSPEKEYNNAYKLFKD